MHANMHGKSGSAADLVCGQVSLVSLFFGGGGAFGESASLSLYIHDWFLHFFGKCFFCNF